ncbi:YwmB family TATA-box binding protein [Bacillus sp. CGMCC 1.16607]|uniref:YwmB family TATA-box binding protein n=1 Tax=Bacillus sp. CGMCC 1.16607 TaxID=3351842 RepID=UPI00362870BE
MNRIVTLLSIIGIVGFVFLQFGNQSIVASNRESGHNELMTIASVLEEEKVDIQEWMIHSREHLTSFSKIEEVIQLQTKLMKEFPNWDWSIHQNNDKWEAIATTKTSNAYKETIKMMATLTNNQLHSYIIYEVKGTKWNQKTEDFFHEKWISRITAIFRGNPTNFSCMKADISDKIDSSLTLSETVNNWLEAFNAKEIESLHESAFVSISASSNLFAEKLQTKHDDMNLQLAIRSNGLGAKTTLVVGTPIITIEY